VTVQPTTGTDVTLPSDTPQPPNLRQQIATMEHQFALAAPRGVEARQIVRDVLTAVSANPKLGDCEPRSVLGSAMTAAQLGLRIGVLGHCWILPFWDSRYEWVDPASGRTRKGGFRAQLIIGYRGLVALAHRSGQIASLSARTVFANDHFDLEYGVNERLVHKPSSGDRGEAIGYYAVARFSNGGYTFWHMTKAEVEHHRDQYAMAKTKEGKIIGPWRDEFEGMAHKTCVRKLAKFMPQNTDLATALAVDDTVRVDVDPRADIVHVSHHIEPAPDTTTARVGDDEFPVEDPPGEGA
jgi:recombination protein RecT